MNDGDLSNKTVVITGGAGGIGRATARRMLAEKASVILVDINQDVLDAAVAELSPLGDVSAHLSRIEDVEAAEKVLDAAGQKFHALVHLAGVSLPDPENFRDLELFDRTIAANTRNAYALMRVIDERKLGSPDSPIRVVLASSMAFRRGGLDRIAYSAAKGGIAAMVRALSRRLAPRVLVNGIAPGIILTPMTEPIIMRRGDDLMREIPLKRYGSPAEVAGVVNFLCGPDAGYVNGQIINIDGGTINS